MARNDIYLNINALSPADAVVTGQQDMTAATIPELVLGDTPTFNFYFTDNTNVWPSWAGNASYTLTWALSDAVAGDFAPAATTSAATAITGGWSVVLPLNAYDLVGLLNTKRVGQPFPVQNLWQQLRVTDPSGNEITRAMFWTPIRYRAISDTQNSESASPTGARFVAVNNVNELTTPTAAQFYAANPVPTSALGTAANGELLIGNGTGFTKSTLTAGDGITITNAAGSITIDASAAQEKLTATVKNAESTPITKGQVVYLFGATGNMASVKLAYNTSDATSAKTFGVVSSSSISAGGTGLVTCVGVVDGLNLGAYQDGDTLYLGATPGSVTATKPYAPNHLVYVGVVERANSGNGELYVKVQNGYELDEIHDVQINAPRQSGQTLIYDNTTSLWKNARITAGTNIGVTNGDGSISIAFSGTLPVANGGTGVTTSTGSGSVVLSTSPTLTTPILGTPQSGTLSSCTGLPISSGVSGLGTNVASALGTNVGSAGAFVVNGGALGTPSSGTLSSCSGLPISSGVSGLGTNVATFLATPSSANLAAAVSDETGSGALVFANTPTLVTPNIGAATGTSFNLTGSGTLGTTLTVSGTTQSSDKDTGAIVTEGGLGVEKNANIGGNATVGGTLTVSGTGNSTIAGNLGIACTPSAWSLIKGVQLNGNAFIGGFNTSAYFSQNWVYDGAEKFISNGYAARYLQDVGTHSFQVTASGTAGGALIWSTAAHIATSGDFLIGTSTDNGYKLDVNGTARIQSNLTVSGTGTSSVAGNLGLGTTSPSKSGSSRTAFTMNAPTGQLSILELCVNESLAAYAYANASQFTFSAQPSRFMSFETGGAETARLTSGGNLLLGTTTDGGQKLQVAGTVNISNAGSSTIANFTNSANADFQIVLTASTSAKIGPSTPTSLILQTNSTTALTLDSSQRSKFEAEVAIGVAPAAYGNSSALTIQGTSKNDPVYINVNGTSANRFLRFVNGGTGGGNIGTSGTDLVIGSGTGTAITVDTSQNATFAGTVTVNGRDLLVNSAGPRVLWKDTSNTQDVWQASVDNDSTQGWNLINNTSGYGTVMRFSRLGALRLNNYGAGTLSTDSSGNVTASSDARLKTNLRTFARGLADVLKLAPKLYNWNEASGLDTENDYVGFVAQDVQTAIPEAVYEGKDQAKTLTLNDRAILAALVNAVKELNAKLA